MAKHRGVHYNPVRHLRVEDGPNYTGSHLSQKTVKQKEWQYPPPKKNLELVETINLKLGYSVIHVFYYVQISKIYPF